jgi:hypothetical protein
MVLATNGQYGIRTLQGIGDRCERTAEMLRDAVQKRQFKELARRPLPALSVSPQLEIQGDLKMPKLDAKGRKRLRSKDFAEPNKRAYPVEDKAHARNAKARASQAVKAWPDVEGRTSQDR